MESLTLPCSEPMMQPRGFAGHWEVFSSGSRTAPCWEGEDLSGGYCSARGSTPCAAPPLGGAREPSPAQKKGTCRGSVSHTSAVAPVPSSLAAPSRPYLPGMVTPAALAASWCNQWGAHGPYLWASCRLGLPAIPISRAAPDLGPRGASPIPAALGPGLGALPRPHADRCGGMLEGAGTSLPSPAASVTLLELQGPS